MSAAALCSSTSWHLAAKPFSPTNIRPHLQTELQDVFTTEVFTTNHQLQPTKFSPGIIFTTRCRSHCCGGTQLLSYSVPRRKFRYVLFSLWHFWGTDYWQFFGVFVRHWQLLERRADLWETREVFPDKPQLVIGAPSSNLADLTWRGGQTKIWANTKP